MPNYISGVTLDSHIMVYALATYLGADNDV